MRIIKIWNFRDGLYHAWRFPLNIPLNKIIPIIIGKLKVWRKK